MRSGPQTHRNATVSRVTHNAPSPLVRFAALPVFAEPPTCDCIAHPVAAGTAIWRSNGVHLGSRLPINLRRFLAAELGTALRVEDDAIVAVHARSDEVLMRQFARAIRRFSAQRAREIWSECAIAVERLENELRRGAADLNYPAVLCMRCTALHFGHGARERHRGQDCLAVELQSAAATTLEAGGADRSPVDGLLPIIEEFRRVRTQAGQAHHDLDCYTANRQVIFTWRPLPCEPAA